MSRFLDLIDHLDSSTPVDTVMRLQDASLGFWEDEADDWDKLPTLRAILERLEV